MVPPIPAPEPAPPRLLADDLPSARYLPGVGPHPGHAHDDRGLQALFVAGVDRFNQRYFWEAHELWERAWRQVAPGSWERELLQGLIQAAATVLTLHLGRREASALLTERADTRLARAAEVAGPWAGGIDLDALRLALRVWAREGAWPSVQWVGRLSLRAPVRVVAGAIVREGRVLVARRREDVARGGMWELPGGKVERGESDEAALCRELHEELGVSVAVHGRIAEVVHVYPDIQIRLVAYEAELLAGEPEPRDHAELLWRAELDDLSWAPADLPLLPAVRRLLDNPLRGDRPA